MAKPLLVVDICLSICEKGKRREMEREKEMRKSKFNRICVFCGSSQGKKKSYQDAAIELGKELVCDSVYIYITYFHSHYHHFFYGFCFKLAFLWFLRSNLQMGIIDIKMCIYSYVLTWYKNFWSLCSSFFIFCIYFMFIYYFSAWSIMATHSINKSLNYVKFSTNGKDTEDTHVIFR